MSSSKRKSQYVSDEFVVSDDDESRPTKRTKPPSSSKSSTKALVDSEGNSYWEISNSRRVTISEFKGKKMVNIREYYEKNGESLPGKKGISLTLEQYSTLLSFLPQIEAKLKDDGVDVTRPDYGGVAAISQEPTEPKDTSEDYVDKKANIEATSDEDEDD